MGKRGTMIEEFIRFTGEPLNKEAVLQDVKRIAQSDRTFDEKVVKVREVLGYLCKILIASGEFDNPFKDATNIFKVNLFEKAGYDFFEMELEKHTDKQRWKRDRKEIMGITT